MILRLRIKSWFWFHCHVQIKSDSAAKTEFFSGSGIESPKGLVARMSYCPHNDARKSHWVATLSKQGNISQEICLHYSSNNCKTFQYQQMEPEANSWSTERGYYFSVRSVQYYLWKVGSTPHVIFGVVFDGSLSSEKHTKSKVQSCLLHLVFQTKACFCPPNTWNVLLTPPYTAGKIIQIFHFLEIPQL